MVRRQPPSSFSIAEPEPDRPRDRSGMKTLKRIGRWPWIRWGLGAIALLGVLDFVTWFVAENLWFQELGYSQVFWLRMQARLGLWLGVTLLSGGFVVWNFRLAWCLRDEDPPVIQVDPRQRVLRRWMSPGDTSTETKARVTLGLRLLLGTLVVLALLLALLSYHYGREILQIWTLGSQLLKQAPELPQQFGLDTVGQDVQMLWANPWQGLLVLALVLLILVFPWPTLVCIGCLLTLGLGFLWSTHWTHVLPLLTPTPFGIQDPQFHKDISFYTFVLPAWELLRFWLVGLLLFMLSAVSVVYLGGSGSISRGLFRGFSVPQRHHLYGLGGGLMLTVALSHWLSRYGRLYSQRASTFFGAGYADVKVLLPVDVALTVIATLIALVLLARGVGGALDRTSGRIVNSSAGLGTASAGLGTASVRRPVAIATRRSPLKAFILHPFVDLWLIYLAVVIVVGNLLPAAVQDIAVQPNELLREQPFIERGIQATRAAFGLDAIEVESFDPSRSLTVADLKNNQVTLENIRLWDKRPLLQTNRQLQQIRLYYSFPNAGIDRYDLTPDDPDQGNQQVIISARELDYESVPKAAQTWVNQHFVYTHGYGFTLSPANIAGEGGLPTYFVKDIGTNVTVQGNEALGIRDEDVRQAMPVNNPRIYYGNLTNTYVMTGSRNRSELDYPSGSENVGTAYDGWGGIPVGAAGRRFAFGLYLRDWRLWLTRNFQPDTKLLFRRNVQSRIQAIAPFLQFDADPYLVSTTQPLIRREGRLLPESETVDANEVETNLRKNESSPNHLYWIVDAYTTSDRYPYSDPGDHRFNYIRNPVKAVVDAYNGSVDFFIADPTDPLIQTWSNIFPRLFQPLDAMPEALRSHIRYPIDLFGIQSERLLTYHMEKPEEFYNREDQWQVPTEIYGDEQLPVEPYYLIMRLPTAEREEFVLLHPFTPVRRNNLIAWLAGRSDGDDYGKLLLYQFPKQRLIFGPEQIEARINQAPEISRLISLWDRQGSRVIQGNLLVIPVEQSLLYVEPLYLKAERNSLPTLIRVIVAYGDRIVMAKDLSGAIAQLFPDNSIPDSSIPDNPIPDNLNPTTAELFRDAA